MVKYIIEHLEPRLYKWCALEYTHISKLVGKSNLIITNLKTANNKNKLRNMARCHQRSVAELDLKNVLLLDPSAKQTLKKADTKKYDYLLFGGILGDYPMRKRTKSMLSKLDLPKRNLGKKQFPTDNAVYVAKQISKGIPFSKMSFMDGLEIPITPSSSVELPFRYAIKDNRPLISKEVMELIRKKGF